MRKINEIKDTIVFHFKEALLSFTEYSGVVSFISIVLILLIMGIFFYFVLQLNNVIKLAENKVEINVFLEDGVSDMEIDGLIREIEAIEGVRNVIFISKQQAFEEFMKNHEMKRLISACSGNPLPASLKVYILGKNFEEGNLHGIAAKIAEKSNGGNVKYERETADILLKIIYFLKSWVIFFITLLGIISFILMVNIFTLSFFYKTSRLQSEKMDKRIVLSPQTIIAEAVLYALFSTVIIILLLYGLDNLLAYLCRVFFVIELAPFPFSSYTLAVASGFILCILACVLALNRIKEKT